MKRTLIILTLMLPLILPEPVHAQQDALGTNLARAPEVDGQRALTAMFPVPSGGSNYFQERLDRPVPAGRSRLLLEYTTEAENWSVRRSVVAVVESPRNGRVRATAILPQGQIASIAPPTVQLPRHMDPRFHRNPLKIEHGTSVLYRWRREDSNGTVDGDVHAFEMPHPLVMLIMGDSYGSGEGAPQSRSTFTGSVTWADRDSHRSNRSGQRAAVVKFRSDHPELWIEFLHLSISGATLSSSGKSGYVTNYRGHRELKVFTVPVASVGPIPIVVPVPVPLRLNVEVESQFGRAEDWLADNGYDRTHVLVLAGGGNDAGFVEAIQGAIFGTLRFDFGNTLRRFRDNIATVIQAAESEFKPALDEMIRPQHVLWTTYPNLTRDQNGGHSGIDIEASPNIGLMMMDLAVGGDDMENAEVLLLEELNPAVRQMCEQILDRCRVVDVEDAVDGHGINANAASRWFNTFRDAQDVVQGAIDGAVHPNDEGQTIYRDAVLASLVELYHPQSGTEYRRMVAEARDAARASARERARQAALARAEGARRRALLNSVESPARAAARTVAANATVKAELRATAQRLKSKRSSRARNNGGRGGIEDILESRLRSSDLRIALPSEARLSEMRGALTRTGRQELLREMESKLVQIGSVERIDASQLRRAIEEQRRTETAGQDRGRSIRRQQ